MRTISELVRCQHGSDDDEQEEEDVAGDAQQSITRIAPVEIIAETVDLSVLPRVALLYHGDCAFALLTVAVTDDVRHVESVTRVANDVIQTAPGDVFLACGYLIFRGSIISVSH